MVFSDSSDKGGIVEEIDFLVDTNSTSYSIDQKVRNVNRALDKVVSLIQQSDGRWKWDDNNQTDYPIATTNLVSGQGTYQFTVDHLEIDRVEWKDANGNWVLGTPIDQSQIGEALDEFRSTDGQPVFYDKEYDSLTLYPAPNYNSTNGLKIRYSRVGSYFADTDTTKEPGFAKPFHRYLSLSAAYDYALKRSLPNRNQLREEMVEMEEAITRFYSARENDVRKVIRGRKVNSR